MRAKITFFILLLTAITLLILLQRSNKKSQTVITSAAPPVIVTPIQLETSDVMDSPDGSRILTLEKKGQFQTIFTSLKTDGQRIQIYKEEVVGPDKLEIPYNTWSPDNTYFFLKEPAPEHNNYFVFQNSENLFPDNLPYLSVQELFNKSVQNYTIEDVTGWADQNSLIVNTISKDTNNKASFWFYVPSQSFIQLSTYFK